MVKLTIDGRLVQVAEGTSILDAAKLAYVNIPHLCHFESLTSDGACGLCVVDIKGERSLTRSCIRPVNEGMVVTTNTPEIRQKKSPYHFIEIMACPGGCVGGGGQSVGYDMAFRKMRGNVLYKADSTMKLRRSHGNQAVQKLYAEYFENPLSEKSHQLLHTKYSERAYKIRELTGT